MNKFKLGLIGLLSVTVLQVGLGTPVSNEYSKEKIQHVYSLKYHHGQGI